MPDDFSLCTTFLPFLQWGNSTKENSAKGVDSALVRFPRRGRFRRDGFENRNGDGAKVGKGAICSLLPLGIPTGAGITLGKRKRERGLRLEFQKKLTSGLLLTAVDR